MNSNSIQVLFPYNHHGAWVFDDESVGLEREPFVCGIDDMIDELTADIPNAAEGFKLLFSPTPFPGALVKLEWRRGESGGNWYWCEQYQKEGWLCPALYKYFDQAPRELHIQAASKG